MLEWLTIIIITSIVMGIVTTMASAGDKFARMSGVMFATFGVTALFWVARVTTPYLRADSTVRWLYKPLADMPEWIGCAGIAITVILWIVSVALLVDDFAHLPRRKKGGRI